MAVLCLGSVFDTSRYSGSRPRALRSVFMIRLKAMRDASSMATLRLRSGQA
jgi:hypothetical protein